MLILFDKASDVSDSKPFINDEVISNEMIKRKSKAK